MNVREANERVANLKQMMVDQLDEYISETARQVKDAIRKDVDTWVEQDFGGVLDDRERGIVRDIARAAVFSRVSLFLSDAGYVGESAAVRELMREEEAA